MAKKSFWNNNWTIGIGTGVIATGVIKLFETFSEYKIFHTLWDGIVWFFGLFNEKYSWPLYGLILLPVLGAAALLLLSAFLGEKTHKNIDSPNAKNKSSANIPNYLKYKSDNFNGVKYIWEYRFDGKNYVVTNLAEMCPKCNCRIISFACPVCKTNYSYQMKRFPEIEALILHKIDNNLIP